MPDSRSKYYGILQNILRFTNARLTIVFLSCIRYFPIVAKNDVKKIPKLNKVRDDNKQ
jgi:hypothetical protein